MVGVAGPDSAILDPSLEALAHTQSLPGAPAIEALDLHRSFGDIEAVAGVSFEVAAGETFGFLGPNGAGKSTTISMLCTLLRPTSGRGRVAGFDVVDEQTEVRRRIGLKCLGGTTVASIQGVIMLAFAGLVHVPYSPGLLLTLVLEMALAAFVITATGIMLASRISQVETFQPVMQFFVMPMFFLSGALFPLTGLPGWLVVLTKIDPLSYAIDPMRRAIFSHISASPALTQLLNAGMTWNGWRLPEALELGLIAVLGLAFLGAAVPQFSSGVALRGARPPLSVAA